VFNEEWFVDPKETELSGLRITTIKITTEKEFRSNVNGDFTSGSW